MGADYGDFIWWVCSGRKGWGAEKGIRSTTRAYLKCKYSPEDTKDAVLEEYPDADKSVIEAIIDELYALVK